MLGGKELEQVQTGVVSANYFDVLGVAPLHAARSAARRPGSEPVLVLSYEYWERVHGGDLSILAGLPAERPSAHRGGILPPLPRYRTRTTSSCRVGLPFRARTAEPRGPHGRADRPRPARLGRGRGGAHVRDGPLVRDLPGRVPAGPRHAGRGGPRAARDHRQRGHHPVLLFVTVALSFHRLRERRELMLAPRAGLELRPRTVGASRGRT
jgi:hypothetical protein